MRKIGGPVVRIGGLCGAGLRWCGETIQRVRKVLSPLADLRIMLIALTLGGALLIFVDAGEEFIRQLVDSAKAMDFQPNWDNALILVRWALFLLAPVCGPVSMPGIGRIYSTKRNHAPTTSSQAGSPGCGAACEFYRSSSLSSRCRSALVMACRIIGLRC
jgi:hypothetical protein